jgi:hypothetical protein
MKQRPFAWRKELISLQILIYEFPMINAQWSLVNDH